MTVHPRASQYTQSLLPAMIEDESELTADVKIEPGRQYGFFTDTTLCIGCKACEVACKEWNALPADNLSLTGMSYDNSAGLSAYTWRHVAFVEHIRDGGDPAMVKPGFQSHWRMLSDVCKHCDNAPCQEACPTGALFRTEFDTVVVQQDICNGCGYCVPACPFGVIDLDELDGKAHKCTLCYDRLKGGLEPACAKACPTDSIQFGELSELHRRAAARLESLHAQGLDNAQLYGAPGTPGATGDLRHLHAFFLITDRPEVYNLPSSPSRGAVRVLPALASGLITAIVMSAVTFIVMALAV
ncbi:MAG TPA: 4Fe-4S dicluster domain-containing protein [Xanthobacteraceae bacterium]